MNNEQRQHVMKQFDIGQQLPCNYKVQRSKTIGHAKNECDLELKRE